MQRPHADVIGLRAAEPSCTVAQMVSIECWYFLVQTVSFSGPGFLRRPRYKNTRTRPFFSRYSMTDDKLTPAGSSPKNLGQSDLEIVVRGDTEIVQGYYSLDPTYVSKVRILNDALREIGMGKYQVWPAYYGLRSPCTIQFNSLCSGIFSLSPGLVGCRTSPYFLPHHVRLLNAAFDSDNLWPVITYSIITPV
jgi:hypothetical protein